MSFETQGSDVNATGTENLLGYAGDDLLASDLRDKLALATRYLANWYKATKGSSNQDAWWQQIDSLRSKVETAYNMLLDPANKTFPNQATVVAYDDAATAWGNLYNRLTLSADANQYGLLDQAADFWSTAAESPGLFVAAAGNEIGKAVGGLVGNTLGNIIAATWPYLIGAAVLGGAYVLRRPLLAIANRGLA